MGLPCGFALSMAIGGMAARRRRFRSVMGDGHRHCALWWAVLLGLASGCAGSSESSSRRMLEPSPKPYESDIPLPVGFRLADQSSEDWASGPVRYVRHRYTGRGLGTAVRRFYGRQMPLVRWIPESEGFMHGTHTLRFRRGSETCTVVVSGGRPDRAGRITIDVLITPRFARAVDSDMPPSRKTP